MELKGILVSPQDLSLADKDRMLVLLSAYFDNACPEKFEEDLREKQWVIILRDKTRKIQGFSTQMILEASVKTKTYKALFSGDTIVSRAFWQQTELMRIWGRLALKLIDEYPQEELFWFLISMGQRTYKFLPVFFKEFYPCYNKPTPKLIKNILDAFASKKYPSEYDARKGLIHFKGFCLQLKQEIAGCSSRNPHLRYFVERNPFYRQGDELACIASLSRENFKPAAYRVIAARSQTDNAL